MDYVYDNLFFVFVKVIKGGFVVDGGKVFIIDGLVVFFVFVRY